jgi:hypothetical protein
MATTIPIVTVSAAERGQFLVRCDQCPKHHTLRPSRPAADAAALDHERDHVTPDPADQITALDRPVAS